MLAWAAYLGEVMLWPAAVVAGIMAGTLTYRVRGLLYEFFELPLYNLWLGVHTYLAMTGYVMPMPGEINSGLTTLGVAVGDNWVATVAALGTPDGGCDPVECWCRAAPSRRRGLSEGRPGRPAGLADVDLRRLRIGVRRSTASCRVSSRGRGGVPLTDNQGNTVNIELPPTVPGPDQPARTPNVLLSGRRPARMTPDVSSRRRTMRRRRSIRSAERLKLGEHLGDPVDYAAYVIAS